jgi:hypothetical protein
MATTLLTALAQGKSNFDDFGNVETGAPAATGASPQPVPEVKKEEQKKTLAKMALFDILMGLLMVFVAWGYNKNESRGAVKILTCVFAFFFWHLYGLYFLIRAGALRQPVAMLKLSDAKKTLADIQNTLNAVVSEARETKLTETKLTGSDIDQ